MNKILDFVRKNKILILIFFGFLLYFPSLFYDFVYDDSVLLLQNQYLNGRIPVNLIDFFIPSFILKDIYTPLTFIICYSIIKLCGISSFVFHFVNILFYLLSSIILYYLLKKIINDDLISFFATILYILHPCHIECTSWISGMGYNIAALFFFLSFYYFILAFDENKKINYIYSVIFYILAILSQPIAVTLPAILFLWVYCFRKEKLKESIIPMFSYIPFLLIYLFLYYQTVLYLRFNESLNYTYLQKISILGFDIFNSFIAISVSPIQPFPSYIYILYFVLFICFIYYFRSNKIFLFFCGFGFISILPYSNLFFDMQFPVADRYLLFFSICFCVLISYLSFYILEKLKNKQLLKYSSFIFFVIIYFFSFVIYLPVLKDNRTLFTYSYNANPNNLYCMTWYSKLLIEDRKFDEAIIVVNRILEMDSTCFDAYGLKIVILTNLNRIDEAIDLGNKMRIIFPNYYKVYLYFFDLYMLKKDYDKVLYFFNIAEEKCKESDLYKNRSLLVLSKKKIKLDFILARPDDFIESLKIISNNFTLMGDYGEFSKILEKKDYKSREEICLNYLKQYNNIYSQSLIFLLSCLYMQETYENDASKIMKSLLNDMDKAQEFINKGENDSAEKVYLDIISKNKYMYQAYYNLGILYLQTDRKEKAKEIFGQMLNINPNDEQIKKVYCSL